MLGVNQSFICLFVGAILVFLPGYDDIIAVRDQVEEDERFADGKK